MRDHASNPDQLTARALGVCWHSPTADRWPCTTTDSLSPAEAATVARFEAADYAPESAVDRVMQVMTDAMGDTDGEYLHEHYTERCAVAALNAMSTPVTPSADRDEAQQDDERAVEATAQWLWEHDHRDQPGHGLPHFGYDDERRAEYTEAARDLLDREEFAALAARPSADRETLRAEKREQLRRWYHAEVCQYLPDGGINCDDLAAAAAAAALDGEQ